MVEVSDDDHELPSLNDDDPYADSGRGLLLVSRFADRWGTSRKAVGKVVRFELAAGIDQERE
ncbi:ATP-binding protein [Kitasatospora sp. NPDC059673]|uniref:ATP-binding protein n=1 Tax=Kitasatospora sp. NPDC059673 TaxID=3346901 RepID=UPI00368A0A8C